MPSGLLAGNDIFEYFLSVGLELTTLIIIPLALWLFKWKHVANDIEKRKEKALLSWGSIRFVMLAVPMLACLIFYYLFMSPAFCYLAIVLGLCLFMVYPSSYQCAKDVSSSQEKVKS